MQADPKADVLEPAGAAELSFSMSAVCLENSSNLERLYFSLHFFLTLGNSTSVKVFN